MLALLDLPTWKAEGLLGLSKLVLLTAIYITVFFEAF
jgi:hypothetical protein